MPIRFLTRCFVAASLFFLTACVTGPDISTPSIPSLQVNPTNTLTSITSTPVLLRPFTPTHTSSASVPTVIKTSTATALPAPELHPLVVISFDGAGAGQVYPWMDGGMLPAFSKLASQGIRAEAMQSVDPSLTASAHASLTTGAYPAKTGIVSNLYHNSNDSLYWYRSGFEQPIEQIDPIWVTASRAGLTTASLFVAGGTPFLPGQTADYTIAYGVRDAYSGLETLKLLPIQEPWAGTPPTTFSPMLEASWIIEKVSQVNILALDSLDDGKESYDTFLLNPQRSFTGDLLVIQPGVWGPLKLDTTRRSWSIFSDPGGNSNW